MLIRSTWKISPSDTAVLPRSYTLELVRDLHKRMDLMMGEESIPSVSYSGLLGVASSLKLSKDFVTFNAGEVYQLSLCGLQEESSKAIATLDLSTSLEFLGAQFEVLDRTDEITSYESLYHSLVASEPEAERRFELKFTTPTAFSQGRTYLPLPLPTLMFRSWLERWNHFAPVYLGGDELIGYLGDAIALTRHRVQTQSIQIHKGRVTGFTGNVTLQSLSRIDPLLANVAHLLIEYAQFSGTGIKTRLGMGQTLRHGTNPETFANDRI